MRVGRALILKRAEPLIQENPEISQSVFSKRQRVNTVPFSAFFAKNENANKIDLTPISGVMVVGGESDTYTQAWKFAYPTMVSVDKWK